MAFLYQKRSERKGLEWDRALKRPWGRLTTPAPNCLREHIRGIETSTMAEDTDRIPNYSVVPDSGTPCPHPRGTETANEGKAAGGNKWAKRKESY